MEEKEKSSVALGDQKGLVCALEGPLNWKCTLGMRCG